jgi:hypothetical protein
MKNSIIALALVAGAFTGIAHAAVTTQSDANNTAAAHMEQVQQQAQKTRAQVRQELIQAQKDGQIAALANLYRGS